VGDQERGWVFRSGMEEAQKLNLKPS